MASIKTCKEVEQDEWQTALIELLLINHAIVDGNTSPCVGSN